MNHDALMAADLDYAAFYMLWRPYDFGDPRTELLTRHATQNVADIDAALARAARLRKAVDEVQQLHEPEWAAVVAFVRARALGASEAACACAADKALFLMSR